MTLHQYQHGHYLLSFHCYVVREGVPHEGNRNYWWSDTEQLVDPDSVIPPLMES